MSHPKNDSKCSRREFVGTALAGATTLILPSEGLAKAAPAGVPRRALGKLGLQGLGDRFRWISG